MIKAGLITFHRAINFGAVLQTYALQKTINECGGECLVVDFRSHEIEDVYKPFLVRRGSVISMVKQTVKSMTEYKKRKIKKNKFDSFVNEYLRLSEPVFGDLEKLNNEFDVFVTGSDQVFNTDITKECAGAYLLSFAEKPRYSYAASFGKDFVAEKDRDSFRTELKKFQAISVREESGVEIVDSLAERKADVSLDPTMLQRAEGWRGIEKKPDHQEDEPFVLVYNMLSSPLLFESALKLSKEKGLKVIFVNNKSRKLRKKYKGFQYRDDISPEEFLWLIDHARYILCSSFHGTVFSILFHKQFLSVLPKDNPKNTRILSLLNLTELSGRVFTDGFDIDRIDDTIDWKTTDRNLEEKREESVKYIESIVNRTD